MAESDPWIGGETGTVIDLLLACMAADHPCAKAQASLRVGQNRNLDLETKLRSARCFDAVQYCEIELAAVGEMR